MSLSTHYYVLSLGAEMSYLAEAFRDSLILVENEGFPVSTPASRSEPIDDEQLHELVRAVDACFDRYYEHEPLGLVLVGDRRMLSAFSSVTVHGSAVIGRIEGDHSGTPVRDLGQIVWPVVKEAMSGIVDRAMRDLENCARRGEITSGLEAVARRVIQGERGMLLVEDDYHMRGRLGGTRRAPVISPDVDVRDTIDDAIDAVIGKALESGGNVVFTPSGSLADRNRIVLLLDRPKSGGSS